MLAGPGKWKHGGGSLDHRIGIGAALDLVRLTIYLTEAGTISTCGEAINAADRCPYPT